MPRKELNIFNISFLDLLSGALAAVIILYVIVPKMTISQMTELEKLQQLEVQVDDVAGMIAQLENSVDAELFIQIKEELNAIKNTIDDLSEQIEQLRLRLANCEEEKSALMQEVEELKLKLVAMEEQVEIIEQLQKELAACQTNNEELKFQISTLEQENESLGEELALVSDQLQNCQEDLKSVLEADVGFKLKGKNVVFILDISGSMREEFRLSEVKAGLKMLLSMMGSEYSADLIAFPDGEYRPYKSLWRRTRKMDNNNRYELLNYLYNLMPDGDTPTEITITDCLRDYPNISDIILLSDGVPSDSNFGSEEDINVILNKVRATNQNRVTINTIGVGSDFLLNTNSDAVRFLKQLASENNGFFVSF